MGKNQKAKAGRVRRRANNRTETRSDALMRSARYGPGAGQVVARKSTRGHGEVRVEIVAGGVLVVSRDHRLPMRDEESALAWLDNL